MEEDVEIEMLLKSNEQILIEAANFTENEANLYETITDDDLQETNGNFSDKSETITVNINNINTTENFIDIYNVQENIERTLQNTKIVAEIESGQNSNQEIAMKKSIHSRNNSFHDEIPLKSQSGYEVYKSESEGIEMNGTDVVQELLDERMVSFMAKKPIKHFVGNATDSDGESNVSEIVNEDKDGEDKHFINEIMDNDEPKYRGRAVEQIRQVAKEEEVRKVSKSEEVPQDKGVNKLGKAKMLILERDALLRRLEVKLQQELYENEEKQRKIRNNLFSLSIPDSNKLREPSFTRCFFKKFGMPYFEDSDGFLAPYNEDYLKKKKRGELIVAAIPRIHYWIKSHKEMFLEAIRKALIDENSEKLRNEIKRLTNLVSDENSAQDNLRKLLNCQDKLRSLRTMSYSDLVAQEDPNREYDWMTLSATVFNKLHTADECRRFWHVYLKPTVNKSSWEMHEDLKLLEIAEQMQYQDWDAIAKLLGTNRTAYQCMVHFQTRIHTNSDYSSGRWTKEEDAKLLSVINASKIGDFIPWTKVSSYMGKRTHNQIYNRWYNCLNPKLVKGKFTKEEDLLIVSGIEVFGVTCKEMASLLNNRSSSQIRERYERHLLPKTAKVGTWSLDEDERLLRLVQKYGEQNWVAVSNEMKTRSRTQVRQRYNFIRHMMKTKPGWTVSQVKRRYKNDTNKALEKTKRHVGSIKQDIEKVEKAFKLSKLESDTFRIEKLKELRDQIMLKKYDLSRKKKVFSDSSEVNSQLLDYFKYSQVKPPIKSTKFNNRNDYKGHLNEILLMAKYFGHKLYLPEFEDEIWCNPRLSYNLKCFLREVIGCKEEAPDKSSVEVPTCSKLSSNHVSNIDYSAPDNDNTLLMNDWWHTPPFDVTNLNFSELLKRTVFDYSYGMHKDIWVSKIERSEDWDVNINCVGEIPDQSMIRQQPIHMPPNHLTTLGFRSLVLSRTRLKRDSTDKVTKGTISDNEEGPKIENVYDLSSILLDQFQETMITLFSWPKVLSVTNIYSTLVPRVPIFPKVKRRLGNNSIISLLNNSREYIEEDIKRSAIGKIREERLRKNLLEHRENRKRQLSQFKRGIRFNRKMKIEHLLRNAKNNLGKSSTSETQTTPKKAGRPKGSKNIKGSKYDVSGNHKLTARQKQNIGKTKLTSSTNQIKIDDTSKAGDVEQSLSVMPTQITYKRTQRNSKRSALSDETYEPVAKKNKNLNDYERITQPYLCEVEECLDTPMFINTDGHNEEKSK